MGFLLILEFDIDENDDLAPDVFELKDKQIFMCAMHKIAKRL